MAQIEFFDEATKSVFANVSAGDASIDPEFGRPGVYSACRSGGSVRARQGHGRQFFYSLDGCLTMIRLPCEIMRERT